MNDPSILLRLREFMDSLYWGDFLWNMAAFCVVFFACGTVMRLIFGKGSGFTQSATVCLSMQFTYLLVIGMYALLPFLRGRMGELPFLLVDSWQLELINIVQCSDATLENGMVRLAILTWITSVLDTHLPRPEKRRNRLLLRFGSTLLAVAVYSFVCLLIQSACPQIFGFWGMVVIVGGCCLILLIGVLHLLLKLVMADAGKGLGGVYRFFYTQPTGRQILFGMLTMGMFLASMLVLNRDGVGTFAFHTFAPGPYAFTLCCIWLLLNLFSSLL